LKKLKNISENSFILGLDLGNSSSAIAFFDPLRKQPEIIDVSGGYGKPAAPTVMQYIPASGEWVFGEYAVLNRGTGQDITVRELISRLGTKDFAEIDGRAVSVPAVLALFLKELIGNCRNMNPKAEIAGIVAAVKEFTSEEAKAELRQAFRLAGYEKELIALVPEKLCVFNKYLWGKPKPERKKENVLMLDFGDRGLYGALYELSGDSAKNLAFLISAEISAGKISDDVFSFFGGIYEKNAALPMTIQTREQLSAFTYQHKDLLFQKEIAKRDLKLYFTFAYPPFQAAVGKERSDALVKPYAAKFKKFLSRLLEKNLYDKNSPISAGEVDTVVCCGGGFEMVWAKTLVRQFFSGAEVLVYKNAKCAVAEGAALIAAGRLEAEKTPALTIKDKLKLKYDVGFKARQGKGEKFIPIADSGSFWWQDSFSRRVVVEGGADGSGSLLLYKRDEAGEVTELAALTLENLPKRPAGAFFLRINIEFESFDYLTVRVCDDGFGAFFEKTGYERDFKIKIF
jgi:hypothetical protein